MESLYLTTSDTVKIAANYFPVDRKKYPNPNGWVVFLHMMPATKESWNPLADRLCQAGYAGIAIDLRGHGASDGGPNGYRNFTDAEHQDSIRDIDAAVDFLKGIGVHEDRISFAGASIGANLALHYIHHRRAFKKAILLSPGLDYHGIVTKQPIAALSPDKQLLLIGSRDDDRVPDNVADVEALLRAVAPGVAVTTEIVDTGGHGTAILAHHPELIETIITFLSS